MSSNFIEVYVDEKDVQKKKKKKETFKVQGRQIIQLAKFDQRNLKLN